MVLTRRHLSNREGVGSLLFSQVAVSARNGAKFLLSDKLYNKFCLQFSKLLIVSFLEKLTASELCGCSP